ncbi:MAG TPA: hypothetical protein VIV12_15500 [Streptosporangiaceae bacterium]
MAVIPVQKMLLTGVAPTFTAVSASDVFANDGKTYIEVKDTNAAADTCTVVAQSTCNQGVLHDSVTTVPATTGDRVIGPFEPTRFNNASGQCTVTHSQVAGVTIAVISESA